MQSYGIYADTVEFVSGHIPNVVSCSIKYKSKRELSESTAEHYVMIIAKVNNRTIFQVLNQRNTFLY